eukprot:COSAG02_NODE_1943_length_10309_cov_29.284721_3_plen_80_part_00
MRGGLHDEIMARVVWLRWERARAGALGGVARGTVAVGAVLSRTRFDAERQGSAAAAACHVFDCSACCCRRDRRRAVPAG